MFSLPSPQISDNGRGSITVQVRDTRYTFTGDPMRMALVRREIHEAWDFALLQFSDVLSVIETHDAPSSQELAKETK